MIKAYLNGVELPELEVPFAQQPIEIGYDVETLSGDVYTDFVALKRGWELRWSSLTEEQYEAIWDIYEQQLSTGDYPLFSVPYYNIENVSVRMRINTKEVWRHCGDVRNVTIELRESNHTSETGSS
jgi:hypothetical protein